MPTPPQRRSIGTKASNDPTFHPSRDMAHLRGDETSTGQQVLLDQSENVHRSILFGAQGRSGGSFEDAVPTNLSRLRTQGVTGNFGLNEVLKSVGEGSRVPTQHWTRNRDDIHLLNEGMPGASGFYQPASTTTGKAPAVAVQTGVALSPEKTLIHEMGHAHHYDQTTEAEREHPGLNYRDARNLSPEPMTEAIADAYVDRYGGRFSAAKEAGDYSHISDRQFGYSSNYEAERSRTKNARTTDAVWVDEDRALYAGARAHFGETGEIPRYQEGPVSSLKETASPGNFRGVSGRASRDATIAHLAEHSPHARAAFSQLEVGGKSPEKGDVATPMADVVAGAVRRTKDRQLLNQGQFIQEGMFHEVRGVTSGKLGGYTPNPDILSGSWQDIEPHFDADMNKAQAALGGEFAVPRSMAVNQQGEKPRTSEDLHESLGQEMPYWTAGNEKKPQWSNRRVTGRGIIEELPRR